MMEYLSLCKLFSYLGTSAAIYDNAWGARRGRRGSLGVPNFHSSLRPYPTISLCRSHSHQFPTACWFHFHGLCRFFFRMTHAPPSSPLEPPVDAALQDYTARTGTKLDSHPITEALKKCSSVNLVTSVLQNHAQAFHGFEGVDRRVMKPIKGAVQVLDALFTTGAVSGEGIGPKQPSMSDLPDFYSFSLKCI